MVNRNEIRNGFLGEESNMGHGRTTKGKEGCWLQVGVQTEKGL
jgi:hypothetical protein